MNSVINSLNDIFRINVKRKMRNSYHQNPLKLIALLSRGSSINDTCNKGGATKNNANQTIKIAFSKPSKTGRKKTKLFDFIPTYAKRCAN